MKIVTNDEFDEYFVIKVSPETKRIALIKLTGDNVMCSRTQFYTAVSRVYDKQYPEIPVPLRLYYDNHLAFADGWNFMDEESVDYIVDE
jgi:hypothetical protein